MSQPPEQPPANPAYPPTAPVHGAGATSADTPARDPEADALFIRFVKDRDAQCPRCGYNVRNLTKPVCPECHELLTLRVGVQELRIGTLIAAIIPGIFSGMCGIVLLIPIIIATSVTGAPQQWEIILIDAFGLVSGVIAMGIIIKRRSFLKLEDDRQLAIAGVLWVIHIAALAIVVGAALW